MTAIVTDGIDFAAGCRKNPGRKIPARILQAARIRCRCGDNHAGAHRFAPSVHQRRGARI
jgi:hypothetical protein